MSLKASILHNFLKEEFANASISLIGQGWSSVVFQVNDYIVRFPKQNMEDYEKEQNICDHISNKISVAVPSVIIYKNKKHPYVIHKKIEGLKWNQHTVCQLSDKNEDGLAQSLAQFFHTLHQQTTGYIAPDFIPVEFDTLGAFLQENADRNLTQLALSKYKNALEVPKNQQKKVLIHGDFTPDNSVLDCNMRLCGVFDWCNCGMGDAITDFIPLYTHLSKEFLMLVISHYRTYSNQPFDFERFKMLFLLRHMYLLYWKYQNTTNGVNKINNMLVSILNKVK